VVTRCYLSSTRGSKGAQYTGCIIMFNAFGLWYNAMFITYTYMGVKL
jgi:hypothetical protein